MPKANRDKLTLQPDIPCTAVLKELRWGEGQRGPYLMLVLNVDEGQSDYPAGEFVYFAFNANAEETSLMQLGIAVKGVRSGKPTYEVRGEPHLRITRAARMVHYELIGAQNTRTGTFEPTVGPVGTAVAGNSQFDQAVREWELLAEEYQTAALIVVNALCNAMQCNHDDVDQQAVQAGVATLIINARERDIVGTPGLARQIWLNRQARQNKAQKAATATTTTAVIPAPVKVVAAGPGDPSAMATMPAALTEDNDDLPF